MKVKCKNCLPEAGIEMPVFNQSERKNLIQLTKQSPLESTKFIVDNFNLEHHVAKYIVNHINKIYGQCNRCKFNLLSEEYTDCSQCGSLNFNWKTNNEL
jgi:hypothetical protein